MTCRASFLNAAAHGESGDDRPLARDCGRSEDRRLARLELRCPGSRSRPMTKPEVVWHEGNFQSYIEDLKKRKGPDADQPHRGAYKKLVGAWFSRARTFSKTG